MSSTIKPEELEMIIVNHLYAIGEICFSDQSIANTATKLKNCERKLAERLNKIIPGLNAPVNEPTNTTKQ